MSVSKRLRYEVMRRDNNTCRYCGGEAPDVKLTIDHVVPVTLGGSDDPKNLVTACIDCNVGKSSSPADAPMVDDVENRSLVWAQAMKDALLFYRADREVVDDQLERFRDAWTSWKYNSGEAVPLPAWRPSVTHWLGVGFTTDDLIALIPEAMKAGVKDEWRYYCKVVWNTLQNIQQEAERLAETRTSELREMND